jgi:glycosyltransferase involved in cell wall biosynthesis
MNAWRSTWPARELARRGYDAYFVGHEGEHATTGWAQHDTVILHATNQDWSGRRGLDTRLGHSGIIKHLRSIGCRGVFLQFDDDYRSLGDMQDIGGWWRDLVADLAEACRLADGVICATPGVEEAYSRWANKTWVIRNHIPTWVTEIPTERFRIEEPVVGWMGTMAAHRRDIEWLGEAAKRITRFGVVGDPGGVEKALGVKLVYSAGIQPGPRHHGGRPFEPRRLYEKMARFSVGIAPVVNDAFNRSKSWIKPLEFAALGIPCVSGDIPEYRKAQSYDGIGVKVPLVIATDGASLVDVAAALTTSDAVADCLHTLVRERFSMEGPGGDAWQSWTEETNAVSRVA